MYVSMVPVNDGAHPNHNLVFEKTWVTKPRCLTRYLTILLCKNSIRMSRSVALHFIKGGCSHNFFKCKITWWNVLWMLKCRSMDVITKGHRHLEVAATASALVRNCAPVRGLNRCKNFRLGIKNSLCANRPVATEGHSGAVSQNFVVPRK